MGASLFAALHHSSPDTMKPTALAAACLAVELIAQLLVLALLLLLLIAGVDPSPASAVAAAPAAADSSDPVASPVAPAVTAAAVTAPAIPTVQPLDLLPVAELRRVARAAGLPRSLTRSGRRADLLAALTAI